MKVTITKLRHSHKMIKQYESKNLCKIHRDPTYASYTRQLKSSLDCQKTIFTIIFNVRYTDTQILEVSTKYQKRNIGIIVSLLS